MDPDGLITFVPDVTVDGHAEGLGPVAHSEGDRAVVDVRAVEIMRGAGGLRGGADGRRGGGGAGHERIEKH